MTARAQDPQYCKYCDETATHSLIYGDASAFIAVCPGHDELARCDIHAKGDGVNDVRDIEGQRSEDFGRRANSGRLLSALADAPPIEEKTIKRSSEFDPKTTSFLTALAADWTVLRARKSANNRLDIALDGQKYTLYMRKG